MLRTALRSKEVFTPKADVDTSADPPNLAPGQRVRAYPHTRGAGRPVVDETAWRPPPTQGSRHD